MYVISSFDHSAYLELALSTLEEQGISHSRILAVPLEARAERRNVFDSIHRSDGISLFDSACVWATVFAVLGAVYGFVLAWGPIVWGLIGAGFGLGFGFLLDLVIHRSGKKNRRKSGGKSEVVILIQCSEKQAEMVEEILYDHMALGVAKIRENSPVPVSG